MQNLEEYIRVGLLKALYKEGVINEYVFRKLINKC